MSKFWVMVLSNFMLIVGGVAYWLYITIYTYRGGLWKDNPVMYVIIIVLSAVLIIGCVLTNLSPREKSIAE